MRIQGRVTDQHGNPIPNAAVKVWAGETNIISTSSDSNGEFRSSTQPSYAGHLIRVEVTQMGYEQHTHQFRAAQDAIEELVVVLNTPPPPPPPLPPPPPPTIVERLSTGGGMGLICLGLWVLISLFVQFNDPQDWRAWLNLFLISLGSLLLVARQPIILPLALIAVPACHLLNLSVFLKLKWVLNEDKETRITVMVIVVLGLNLLALVLLDRFRAKIHQWPIIGKFITPDRLRARGIFG